MMTDKEYAQELVNQLIYNEINRLIDLIENEPEPNYYGFSNQAELDVYKREFPGIYSEVSEALYCEQHGI